MTQIAFIPIAAETELAYICTSGIYPICPSYPICPRLSQARGFQHHLDNSSCQTVPTPGPSPEKTNLDWDYIVLSIIKLDRNQAIHLDWGNWFFSRASQIKPLDGLQQEKPSSFFMATPRLSAPSSMRLKNSYKFQFTEIILLGTNNILYLVPMVRRNWRGHPEEYLPGVFHCHNAQASPGIWTD